MRKFTTLAMVGLLRRVQALPPTRRPSMPIPSRRRFPKRSSTARMPRPPRSASTAKGCASSTRPAARPACFAFGVPRAGRNRARERIAGKEDDRSTNAECGAGSMEFTRYDAMTLNFQDGKFIGWFLGNEPGARAYSTMRAALRSVRRAPRRRKRSRSSIWRTASLGEEFSIGSGDNVIGGMFAAPGDAARIDALFAGANCFFR